MASDQRFYTESGATDVLGSLITYMIGGILALVLAYYYVLLTTYIPLIYFVVFLTIGFGFVLMVICRILFRLNRNRSKRARIVQAIVIGLLASYFQWAAYLQIVLSDTFISFGEYLSGFYWLVNPVDIIRLMISIAPNGLWEIGGIPVNGFLLWLIWIAEALILIGIPVISAIRMNIYPYSEKLSRWYPKLALRKDFGSISSGTILLVKLEQDVMDALAYLGKGLGNSHTQAYLFYLPDETDQYLSFERVFVKSGSGGKKKRTMILQNYRIDRATAQEILAKYETSRNRVDEYF